MFFRQVPQVFLKYSHKRLHIVGVQEVRGLGVVIEVGQEEDHGVDLGTHAGV